MDQPRQSFLDVPVIEKGDYEYLVHPTSDGALMLGPGLLCEIVTKIIYKVSLENVDKTVTPVAMGAHILTVVSLMTDIPLAVVRKREYDLDDEMSFHQQAGYSEGDMFINDVNEDDRVLVLGDVLSIGGTMKVALDMLDHISADAVDTVVIIKKAGPNELDDSDHHVKTFINAIVENGEVVIVDEHGDD